MNVLGSLEAMEAPPTLTEWVQQTGDQDEDPDWAALWRQCPVPPWLLWLAGAGALPLTQAISAVGQWANDEADRVPEAQALVQRAVRLAQGSLTGQVSGKACLEAAEAAESAAASAPATFRNAAPRAFQPLAMGAAWLCRAAEGLQTAERRVEASRLDRARNMASYLGAGVDLTLGSLGRAGPIRLNAARLPADAFHSELLYVVAALAEAASALARARDLHHPDSPAGAAEALRGHFAQVM